MHALNANFAINDNSLSHWSTNIQTHTRTVRNAQFWESIQKSIIFLINLVPGHGVYFFFFRTADYIFLWYAIRRIFLVNKKRFDGFFLSLIEIKWINEEDFRDRNILHRVRINNKMIFCYVVDWIYFAGDHFLCDLWFRNNRLRIVCSRVRYAYASVFVRVM